MAFRSQLHRQEFRAAENRKPRKPRDAYEVPLTDDQRKELAIWLSDEIQAALDAKGVHDMDVDYWHTLYEQGRTRIGRNAPWPDAADLTSHLACQMVDSIQARAVRTVMVEPIWTVEGWGDSASKAPFVEEFHQWKAEEERLQSVIDKWFLISLIEPRGLLEVTEGTELRPVRKTIQAALELDPITNSPIFDLTGNPKLLMDDAGRHVQAQSGEPSAEVIVDSLERVRTGPQYRVIPYRDSVILPGHARDREEIWGYGKRLWRRLPEIVRLAKKGVYDQASVDQLTNTGEREPTPALTRSGVDVAPQEGPTAEKELWEVLVLLDLSEIITNGSVPKEAHGERWYVCTLHLGQQLLFRIQHDDIERSRYVPVILFPRPDRATEGFSLVGHKLITVVEEHTAWRNMLADRAAMQVQSPIKKLQNALWDEYEQPWGPKAVITVRDMNEVQPVQVPDLTAPAFNHVEMLERNAERLVGVNDIATGQVSAEQRTLGEIQQATAYAEIRMDLIVRRMQEALEDLFQIRHAIYKRMLAEEPEGVDAPQSVLLGLETRQMQLPGGRFTAQLLEGNFRGKPRGSVETADPGRLQANFSQFLQTLTQLVPVFPALQTLLTLNPNAAREMLEHAIRIYRIPGKQAILGPPPVQPGMGLMGGQFGLPPLDPAMAGLVPGFGAPSPEMGMDPMAGVPLTAPPESSTVVM